MGAHEKSQDSKIMAFNAEKLKCYVWKESRIINKVGSQTFHLNKQRILHGHAEIQNFSASVEKYVTNERNDQVKYFSTLYYTNNNEIPNHFISMYFCRFFGDEWDKGLIYLCNHSKSDPFTSTDNMFFSQVKIDIILSCESSPGIKTIYSGLKWLL